MKRPWRGATRYLVVRSLAHPGACVRACMRACVRRYARVLRILLQLRSQTAVPALGDRQFGLLGVTKVLCEDRQTRMRLRGRTLRAREINERPSLRRNGMPTARTRFCQDTSGYYPRTYRRYVALVGSRQDAHLSIKFCIGEFELVASKRKKDGSLNRRFPDLYLSSK